jgi:hypothetical protein
MANIRISAIRVEIDEKIAKVYSDYISTADESVRQDKQKFLERAMAPIYGAKLVAGNPPLVPDYYVDPQSLISGIAPFFQRESSGSLEIEAKFQRKSTSSKTTTTIGGRVSSEVLPEILKRVKGFDQDQDLYTYMSKQLKISRGAMLFNYLRDNAPKFHNEAYNKAKNLTIFSKSGGSILAYQIYFPKSKFVSGIFGATYSANQAENSYTFSYYLNNSFEKALTASAQASITNTSIEDFRNLTYDKVTKSGISYGRGTKETKATQTVNIYWPHTNSVPVANIKTKIPRQQQRRSQQASILDITMLVRGRTKLKMRRGSAAPSPPKIYERSGAFRGSIEAVANMNTNIINYFYTPYYDALQRYGYTIQDMVEGSIRDIARERLGGQFILRKNTQTII